MKTNSELNPESPSQVDTPSVVTHYSNISPDITAPLNPPPIAYVEAWGKWVVNRDDAVEAFPNEVEFQENFPYAVVVREEEGIIRIEDYGTGGGSTFWTFTTFQGKDGSTIAALTQNTIGPEEADSEIWFGKGNQDGFESCQAMVGLAQEDFFDAGAEEILDKYPLVSIVYDLVHGGEDLRVSSIANFSFICHDGKPLAENIPESDKDLICQWAWPRHTTQEIIYTFNPESSRFEEKARTPVAK